MDSVFWIGIVLGGAVGFVVSIVANLSTPRFGDYFQRSKIGWLERSKRRALNAYQFILRFRNGTEDKYMYFVAQWGYILFFLLFLVFCFVMIMTSRGALAHTIGTLGAVFGLFQTFWIHRKLSLWYWRMNNFEKYKASVKEKWPDLDVDVLPQKANETS